MERVRFCCSGEFAAVAGTDGRLRIWETHTNSLKYEFTPSSHLSATCTCLEWAPNREKQQKKRKKMVKSEHIVMGTAVGSLLFYDVTQAELVAHSKEVHAGKVTGLAWSSTSLALYSCGEDGYILEWDAENTNVTRRWRGSKTGLSSIQVFQENLITAGQGITLWDLKTTTSIASFTGHPNQVVQMESVPQSNYFITMGQDERFLKIWSTAEKNSIASLSIPEIPKFFSLSVNEHGRVSVSVITQKGQLHLFQHKLNGPIRKPILAQSTLKITDSLDSTKIVPILATYLTPDVENATVLGGYGSWTNLRFESFEVSSLQSQSVISREFSLTGKKSSKSKNSQNDLVEVPLDVKHLQPGTDTGVLVEEKAKKRKRGMGTEDKVEDGELPMEERLTNLTITTSTSGIRENNLAHLLSQGLHSKDVRILHSVLSRWDEEVITNTIRSLPVQLVVPLLNQAKLMLAGKGQLNNSIVKWIKIVIQVHSSYLMCCPSTEELLGPFMALLRTREVLYPQMSQLKGKLQLIKGHIEAKQYRSEPANEELLHFNDEPADAADDEDDMIPSDSDEALSSDDLGVEDDSSDEKDSDIDEMESKLTESEDDVDEVVAEVPEKNAKKGKKSTEQNHNSSNNVSEKTKKKIKGKVLDEDSGPESMDEDG